MTSHTRLKHHFNEVTTKTRFPHSAGRLCNIYEPEEVSLLEKWFSSVSSTIQIILIHTRTGSTYELKPFRSSPLWYPNIYLLEPWMRRFMAHFNLLLQRIKINSHRFQIKKRATKFEYVGGHERKRNVMINQKLNSLLDERWCCGWGECLNYVTRLLTSQQKREVHNREFMKRTGTRQLQSVTLERDLINAQSPISHSRRQASARRIKKTIPKSAFSNFPEVTRRQ